MRHEHRERLSPQSSVLSPQSSVLASYLVSHGLIDSASRLVRVRRIGLGQSNLTFVLGFDDGRELVLRRPPLGPLPPSAHDVLREYRVIRALHGGPVPVAQPILACEDAEVIGAPFYLMERVPGDALRFELPPDFVRAPARRRVGEQAVDALAALHSLDPAQLGLAELGRPSGYLTRQLRRWRSQLEFARTRPLNDLDWTADWLAEHLPDGQPEGKVVHGDYKLDNLLFAPEPPTRLLAVVDWEMATLGDPLADVGWLLAFWRQAGDPPPELKIMPRLTESSGFSTREELVARYAARVGRDLPDLKFYLVLALWKMAVLLEGHWARNIRGTAAGFDFSYLETGNPAFAARVRRVAEGSR